MNSLIEVISVCLAELIALLLNFTLEKEKQSQCSVLVSIAGFGGCVKQMDEATQNGSHRKPHLPQTEVQGQDCSTVTDFR